MAAKFFGHRQNFRPFLARNGDFGYQNQKRKGDFGSQTKLPQKKKNFPSNKSNNFCSKENKQIKKTKQLTKVTLT
jgi:hypothetical protein